MVRRTTSCFEPDDSGRCPLCQPTSGDVVADLLAERATTTPTPAVVDSRLEEAGLLGGSDRRDGAA